MRPIIAALLIMLFGAAVVAGYIFQVYRLQFCLGLPWSVLVAILSPLIGHMFGAEALPVGLFLCGVLNCILLAFWLYRHMHKVRVPQ
jgi:hypothetical protein